MDSDLDLTMFFPQALQAYPGENYKVYAYLNDGSVRMLDISERVKKGGAFAPLRDEAVYKNAITVMNDTVAWDLTGDRDESRCIDIDPFEFFNTPPVKDPLEA